VPVFARGLKFYDELNVQLIQELDSEIKRTEKEIDVYKAFREFQLNQMAILFNMVPQTMNTFYRNGNKKLEDAIDTLRQKPVFGYNTYEIDFSWPKERDLL